MSKMKALKRFLTVLMAAVLLMSACAPAALASFQAKINSSTKVYSVPSTSGRSVRVPKGLTVTVSGASGSWARVSYKGVTAYIPVSYLNLVNRLTAYTAKSTPVYKQASSSSSRMGTLSIGTAVYVVGKSGSYYRIQNSSGSVTGYVNSSYLTSKAKITAAYNAYKNSQKDKEDASENESSTGSTTSGETDSSGDGSTSSSLLSLLKSLYGKPYAESANPPSSFNCSVLVNYVMGKFGIPMKGTAAAQANDSRYTKITSLSDLKVGDILCFDTDEDGNCDHTAIYIGGNKFVEASQNAGKVHENDLDSWYKAHFKWARRP